MPLICAMCGRDWSFVLMLHDVFVVFLKFSRLFNGRLSRSWIGLSWSLEARVVVPFSGKSNELVVGVTFCMLHHHVQCVYAFFSYLLLWNSVFGNLTSQWQKMRPQNGERDANLERLRALLKLVRGCFFFLFLFLLNSMPTNRRNSILQKCCDSQIRKKHVGQQNGQESRNSLILFGSTSLLFLLLEHLLFDNHSTHVLFTVVDKSRQSFNIIL